MVGVMAVVEVLLIAFHTSDCTHSVEKVCRRAPCQLLSGTLPFGKFLRFTPAQTYNANFAYSWDAFYKQ